MFFYLGSVKSIVKQTPSMMFLTALFKSSLLPSHSRFEFIGKQTCFLLRNSVQIATMSQSGGKSSRYRYSINYTGTEQYHIILTVWTPNKSCYAFHLSLNSILRTYYVGTEEGGLECSVES